MKKRSIIWTQLTDVEFRALVKKSETYADIRQYFGYKSAGNARTIKKRIDALNIDTSHFIKNDFSSFRKSNPIPLVDVLVENSTYNRAHLKRRLLNNGVLKNVCSICSLTPEWNGQKLVMVLDHINGVDNDHRLNNLRMVCPNCNSQLPTHSGRNIKKVVKVKKVYYCDCGSVKAKNSTRCKQCYALCRRKVTRPSKEQLQQDIEKMSFVKIGQKYGVSDNAIRKWMLAP